jgi:hypothetical protein
MKERPIIFSADSIRAILEDRKTQTRRVIKPQPPHWTWNHVSFDDRCINIAEPDDQDGYYVICPFGKRGDHLWVRETCAIGFTDSGELACDYFADGKRRYFEQTIYNDSDRGWMTYINDGRRPSIFMPRWASRITLEIVAVRVERVQEITFEQIISEGIDPGYFVGNFGDKTSFAKNWDKLNSKRGYPWSSNPWVWVIEFKRLP